MLELRCPKCGSTRIHHGYNQAPLYKRVCGFQNLLCNGCNLLFTAFVWPGAVKQTSRRKRKPRTHLVETSQSRAHTHDALHSARAEVIVDDLEEAVNRLNAPVVAEPVAAPPQIVELKVVAPAREMAAAETATPRPRHEKKEAPARRAGVTDYTRFGFYYSSLYLKSKFGLRKATNSLDMKFRWRNWWHWQRSRAE